ncbi:MAG: ribosome biogenesis GTP-binding protein YihA/YsxC [Polyangiales bacterium]
MKILDAQHIAAVHAPAEMPAPHYAEVAFAGRSNVGKSSLINCLVARRRLVRTSNTPGCTRAIHCFRVRYPGGVLDLVDLPGYGYAKRSKQERRHWASLIEGFLAARDNLRWVLVLVDSRRGLGEEDAQLLDFLRQIGRPALLVWTKCDKLKARERHALVREQKRLQLPAVAFSAQTGQGRDALWQQLLQGPVSVRPAGRDDGAGRDHAANDESTQR